MTDITDLTIYWLDNHREAEKPLMLFYLGEHGWFEKRFVYDESFKTPLCIIEK